MNCPREDIFIIGNNAVDRVFYVNENYHKNGKQVASDMHVFQGGQAANVAFTVSQLLENKVTYIGIFGNDSDAEMNRQSLENVNIDELILKCNSNTSSIIVDKLTGERLITFYPSISLHLIDKEYEIFVQKERDLSKVKIIYSDCRLIKLTKTIFKKAKKLFIPIVIDLETICNEHLIKYADYLITNGSIIQELANEDNLNRALEIVLEKYEMKGVAATLGNKGFLCIDKKNIVRKQESYKINIADTTGAGDAFHAAFIVAMSRNIDFFESLCFANFVASRKCETMGPRLNKYQLEQIRREYLF